MLHTTPAASASSTQQQRRSRAHSARTCCQSTRPCGVRSQRNRTQIKEGRGGATWRLITYEWPVDETILCVSDLRLRPPQKFISSPSSRSPSITCDSTPPPAVSLGVAATVDCPALAAPHTSAPWHSAIATSSTAAVPACADTRHARACVAPPRVIGRCRNRAMVHRLWRLRFCLSTRNLPKYK